MLHTAGHQPLRLALFSALIAAAVGLGGCATETPEVATPGPGADTAQTTLRAGEAVTTDGQIARILGPRAFVMTEPGLLGGQEILVLHPAGVTYEQGARVQITGQAQPFDASVVRADYGIDLTPDFITGYKDRPVILAKEIDLVRGT